MVRCYKEKIHKKKIHQKTQVIICTNIQKTANKNKCCCAKEFMFN